MARGVRVVWSHAVMVSQGRARAGGGEQQLEVGGGDEQPHGQPEPVRVRATLAVPDSKTTELRACDPGINRHGAVFYDE